MDVEIAKGKTGGPAAGPVPDLPAGRFLTLPERRVIEYGLRRGDKLTVIADELGRDKSVISREVARNKTRDGRYVAAVAHLKAWLARRRPKEFKLHNRGLNRPGFRGGSVTWNQPLSGRVFRRSR